MSLKTQYPQEWNIWYNMKYRCGTHQKYLDVSVCERWQDFANFLNDMGKRPSEAHSIDRKDPYGDYEPANCRWATQSVQTRNQRNNRLRNRFNPDEYDYWWNKAKQNGILGNTFQWRLRHSDMTLEEAATKIPKGGKTTGV